MKRACPYDANLLRSTKVHLMDHNVEAEARNKMFEQTLQKLKDGARNSNNLTETLPEKVVSNDPYSKSIKQTLLSNYFKESTSGFATKLLVADPLEDMLCNYCEKKAITKLCVQCGEVFCSSCCINLYDSREEAFICLSCS